MSQLKHWLIFLVVAAIAGSTPALAEEVDSQPEGGKQLQKAEALLQESMETGDNKKLDEAASIVESQLTVPGVNKEILAGETQNVAQLYQASDQPTKSLEWWHKLLSLEPDNWRAWSKIVQCAQALGDEKERETAREKVLSLNKEGKVDQKMFCREQFKRGEDRVMVMEYFKPDTKFGVEIVFLMYPPATPDKVARRYTLGELAGDTAIARELKTIKPDDHLYSIDGFNDEGQWLVQMVMQKPSYDELRKIVVADMEKEPNSTGTGMKYPKKTK